MAAEISIVPSKQEILEREKRWRVPAGIAAVAGVAVLMASLASLGAGTRLAERLVNADGEHGRLLSGGIGQLIGWSLLAIPLGYLYRAASARSARVRPGLIGLVIAAPIIFGLGLLASAGATIEASENYVENGPAAIEKCLAEKDSEAEPDADRSKAGSEAGEKPGKNAAKDGKADEAANQGENAGNAADKDAADEDAGKDGEETKSPRTECEDQVAEEAQTGARLASWSMILVLFGMIGFSASVVYTTLWARRTGLMTRFWGALGIALGAVFILQLFSMLLLGWFVYLGLMLIGWIPGGRPPAWEAGEAVVLPPSGGLFGGAKPEEEDEDGAVDEWGEPIEGSSEELPPSGEGTSAPPAQDAPEAPELPGEGGSPDRPRKRKKRNG